jgi:hypothetical protein
MVLSVYVVEGTRALSFSAHCTRVSSSEHIDTGHFALSWCGWRTFMRPPAIFKMIPVDFRRTHHRIVHGKADRMSKLRTRREGAMAASRRYSQSHES